MIRSGEVPFISSLNTSIWLVCVPSTLAWQAAMPLPGTITACTPRKNIESLFTHVADAMTIRPVDRSTATIDQVALATDGNRTRNRKRILFIGQLRGSFSALPTPHSAHILQKLHLLHQNLQP